MKTSVDLCRLSWFPSGNALLVSLPVISVQGQTRSTASRALIRAGEIEVLRDS